MRVVLLLLASLFIVGCQSSPTHPTLMQSDAPMVEGYASFEEYVQKTEAVIERHRHFLTDNKQQEIDANRPFELQPKTQNKVSRGVLLIHGLGDSPWSFRDIGESLAEQGFLVRTVLLSGHGTRPGDLISADFKDWQALVQRHAELLKTQVEEVYLGGFSTGGNLAYIHAASDLEIKGLMLFSPAFELGEPGVALTPLLASLKTWLDIDNPEDSNNYVRYSNVPTNGFAQYYYSSKAALEQIENRLFDRPVFLVLSEDDSVVGVSSVRETFQQRFTHPKNRLMWFGSESSGELGKLITVNSRMPEFRISSMSHMGMLFSPDNPYYGIHGTQRICDNGQEPRQLEAECRAGKPVWYSAWGYQEAGKTHARSTFNPVFDQMMDELVAVFSPQVVAGK